jgi:hypothetical protein
VRSHDKPAFFVLHADDYALVEPLLVRRRQGLPIAIGELLTDDDFAVMDEERALDAGLDRSALSSWNA